MENYRDMLLVLHFHYEWLIHVTDSHLQGKYLVVVVVPMSLRVRTSNNLTEYISLGLHFSLSLSLCLVRLMLFPTWYNAVIYFIIT